MSRPNSARVPLANLHDAARKGNSRSLQRLISIIDPTAAEKVAAVLVRQRESGSYSAISATGTDPSPSKKVAVAVPCKRSEKTLHAIAGSLRLGDSCSKSSLSITYTLAASPLQSKPCTILLYPVRTTEITCMRVPLVTFLPNAVPDENLERTRGMQGIS